MIAQISYMLEYRGFTFASCRFMLFPIIAE
jgi:hypothetical protein